MYCAVSFYRTHQWPMWKGFVVPRGHRDIKQVGIKIIFPDQIVGDQNNLLFTEVPSWLYGCRWYNAVTYCYICKRSTLCSKKQSVSFKKLL